MIRRSILTVQATAFTVLALTFVCPLLGLSTAAVVGIGTLLNYLLPAISLEFACMIAGLSILIGLVILSGVFRFLASIPPIQFNEEELDDDEPVDFAEHIAEVVSSKLEPHLGRQRRSKTRR